MSLTIISFSFSQSSFLAKMLFKNNKKKRIRAMLRILDFVVSRSVKYKACRDACSLFQTREFQFERSGNYLVCTSLHGLRKIRFICNSSGVKDAEVSLTINNQKVNAKNSIFWLFSLFVRHILRLGIPLDQKWHFSRKLIKSK